MFVVLEASMDPTFVSEAKQFQKKDQEVELARPMKEVRRSE